MSGSKKNSKSDWARVKNDAVSDAPIAYDPETDLYLTPQALAPLRHCPCWRPPLLEPFHGLFVDNPFFSDKEDKKLSQSDGKLIWCG